MRRVSDEQVASIIADAGLDERDFADYTEGLARDLRDTRALLDRAEAALRSATTHHADEKCEVCQKIEAVLRDIAASKE